MLEYIRNELLGLSDKGNYAAFTSALIPGCDNVIGVAACVKEICAAACQG